MQGVPILSTGSRQSKQDPLGWCQHRVTTESPWGRAQQHSAKTLGWWCCSAQLTPSPLYPRAGGLCRPLLWKGAPENHEPSSFLSHSIAISLEIPGLSGALLGLNVLLSDPRKRLRPTWMERSRTVYSTDSLTPCTWMVKGP